MEELSFMHNKRDESILTFSHLLHKDVQLKGVKTRLLSRRGFYLSVEREKVIGVKEDTDSTIFYLIPVGLRIVSIQHMETMKYIAMSGDGRLYASDVYTLECKFKESVFENYYVVYTSTLYKQLDSGRPWNVGLDRNGLPVKGSRAKKHRSCAHFIPNAIEVKMFKEPSLCDLALQAANLPNGEMKKRKI